jgi:hypothetical protein
VGFLAASPRSIKPVIETPEYSKQAASIQAGGGPFAFQEPAPCYQQITMPPSSSSSSRPAVLLRRLLLPVTLLAATLAATSHAFVLPIPAARPTPQQAPAIRSTTRPLQQPLRSTAAGSNEGSSSSSSETVLWLRGLSNTFDGNRYQFKDISLSLAKGACECVAFCFVDRSIRMQSKTPARL